MAWSPDHAVPIDRRSPNPLSPNLWRPSVGNGWHGRDGLLPKSVAWFTYPTVSKIVIPAQKRRGNDVNIPMTSDYLAAIKTSNSGNSLLETVPKLCGRPCHSFAATHKTGLQNSSASALRRRRRPASTGVPGLQYLENWFSIHFFSPQNSGVSQTRVMEPRFWAL